MNYIVTLWDCDILCLVVSKTNKVIPKMAKFWLRTKGHWRTLNAITILNLY